MSRYESSPAVDESQGLWTLIASPAIWAAHFLMSYITASVWCAKWAGADGALSSARLAIVVYTVAAVVAISAIGWRGFRRHKTGGTGEPHDADTPEDRGRFVGLSTALLSGLSGIAVVYAALTVIFVETCR